MLAPPSQFHLPGAHRADLADHRRAVRRPVLDRADPGGGVRRIRRSRRLAGQAIQLDLAARQDPRSARRQTTARGVVPHRRLDQPAALVAYSSSRGARRHDRLRRGDLSILVRAIARPADTGEQDQHRHAARGGAGRHPRRRHRSAHARNGDRARHRDARSPPSCRAPTIYPRSRGARSRPDVHRCDS